jgi:acyl-CoA:acyl-CoA alkyltransferase
MLFKNVSIHTVAHLEAPLRVTSAEISARLAKTLKRVRLPLNYLERMTGIKERRFWDKNQLPSEVATMVAEKVIEKSGLSKSDIGAVINTSITKEFIEPSIASIIHGNLQMSAECMNFDLGNACIGFLNGIQIAATMLESNHANHILVVAAESSYEGVSATLARLELDTAIRQDVTEQLATLTLGSGAVAMIISRSTLAPKGHPIRGLTVLAATEHNKLCVATTRQMVTNAPKLLAQGVLLKLKTYQKAQKELNWQNINFDEFALHQVSNSYLKMSKKALGIESLKVFSTFPEYGNMGTVSLPFTISLLEEAGRLIPGKKLAILGTGSGLNSMAMEVQW